MPLFGKSKKAQETKKQDEPPAAKPAPYRHVPKHAASDARNHGISEADRAAQQKRIMAASQSRLNSMNSNYSVKGNFNDVPIKGTQSKPFVFTASSSPRQSLGNATSKDRSAVQPAGPGGATPSPQQAQADYVKLRNPSLLSNTTGPRSSSPKPPVAVKHQSIPGGVGSSDSGYGSVGQTSRPDSKAPSTISKAPSEVRYSQDLKATPRSSAGLDFLPKLDFNTDSSQATSSPDKATPVNYATKAATFTSRNRGMSNSSGYVSRLDPGSDRRSTSSFQSRPFDQIDFSKPGQQIAAASPSSRSAKMSDSRAMAAQEDDLVSRQSAQPVQKPPEAQSIQQIVPQSKAPKNSETQRSDTLTTPPQLAQSFEAQSKAGASQETPRSIAREPELQSATVERSNADSISTQPASHEEAQPAADINPESTAQESLEDRPLEQMQSQTTDAAGTQWNPKASESVASATTAIEDSNETMPALQTQSEQSKPPVNRHRNWSRPSQSSGSQLDYDRSDSTATVPEPLFRSQAPHSERQTRQQDDSKVLSYQAGTQGSSRTSQDLMSARGMNFAQVSQTQQQPRWNDQSSSIYGESSYNPSTRQTSPVRRQSLAPSDILDPRAPMNGQPALAPLSILDGLKVNKRGKILDEEGDPIGELVEGDIIDCVRQKANAFGQVLDDYGRVVGRVVTINRAADGSVVSPTTTMRSQGFSIDHRPNMNQRYAPGDSQLVSPATPTLAKPFEYRQEEDPRQRAADLQAAAARSAHEPQAQIELDGSGYAEAAPLVDHSEIFAPPFIPSRSPKRSPAEPAPHMMESYFKPLEKTETSTDETPRLRKWASRNLEQDREEVSTPKGPAPPMPTQPVQPPSESSISRPSTRDTAVLDHTSTVSQSDSNTAAQDFISADQPKDIFPWMTNQNSTQDAAKWNPNIFTFKGGVPMNTTSRQSTSTARAGSMTSQSHSSPSTAPAPKQSYGAHLSSSPGSRSSKRTSFQHQPHVKSPLSTHSTASFPNSKTTH